MLARPSALPARKVVLDRIRDGRVKWIDSGTTFTNVGATGPLTFTIESAGNVSYADVRGTSYAFVVTEAYPITIILDIVGFSPGERIFRAGGWATAGTQVSSPAVIGNRIELQLIDGQGGSYEGPGVVGYRWLITSETGTWTISGMPLP